MIPDRASRDVSIDQTYTATKIHIGTEDPQKQNVFSSDEDIPMAQLRPKKTLVRKQRQVRRTLIDEIDGESDDSFNDESYHPDDSSANSTESEDTHVIRQQKKTTAARMSSIKQRNKPAGTRNAA